MISFWVLDVSCEIDGSFWLWTALFGFTFLDTANGPLKLGVWVVCGLVSIFVHEMGHALAARRFGVRPHVLLYSFGGLTFLSGKVPTRTQGILISLAGPAAGLSLYAATRVVETHLLRKLPDGLSDGVLGLVAHIAVDFLVYMNRFWTLLNLLPVLPLDGGQVLSGVLGPQHLFATRMIGAACAAGAGGYAALHGWYFIALFFGALAYSNFTGDTRSFTGRVRPGWNQGRSPQS